jgi:hypothetical protein
MLRGYIKNTISKDFQTYLYGPKLQNGDVSTEQGKDLEASGCCIISKKFIPVSLLIGSIPFPAVPCVKCEI